MNSANYQQILTKLLGLRISRVVELTTSPFFLRCCFSCQYNPHDHSCGQLTTDLIPNKVSHVSHHESHDLAPICLSQIEIHDLAHLLHYGFSVLASHGINRAQSSTYTGFEYQNRCGLIQQASTPFARLCCRRCCTSVPPHSLPTHNRFWISNKVAHFSRRECNDFAHLFALFKS